MRFKKGSKYVDKVLPEPNIMSELEKRAQSAYWQELESISLTPNAKVGLGVLFTFEFVAPCFEDKTAKSPKEAQKLGKMSFYG